VSFETNEKFMELYRNWGKEHDKTCPYLKTGSAAAGGRTSFCFTPNVGIEIAVRCVCGNFVDITDSSEW